jgi:hypothetical protein
MAGNYNRLKFTLWIKKSLSLAEQALLLLTADF